MLHETISSLRRKQGWSQEQFAERVGVSRQTVSKWETGVSVPELEKLLLISQCFGVTVDQLLGTRVDVQPAPSLVGVETRWRRILGLILAVTGACYSILLLWMRSRNALFIQQLNESFHLEVSGTGLMMGLSILFILLGGCFIIRKK